VNLLTNGEPLRMSKRAGTAITMDDLVDAIGVDASRYALARYTNDYYFQVEHDLSRTPGNPWFICTLWLAQWYIAIAKSVDQLQPARDIIDWVVAHKTEAGMLSEQVDPNSGAPLSVAPLTWSHAEFVVTVDDYVKKLDKLRQSRRARRPPTVVG